jgi:hypothetical protein
LTPDGAAVYDHLGTIGFCNRSRKGSFIFRSEFQSLGVVEVITATLTRSSKGVPSITVFRPTASSNIQNSSIP